MSPEAQGSHPDSLRLLAGFGSRQWQDCGPRLPAGCWLGITLGSSRPLSRPGRMGLSQLISSSKLVGHCHRQLGQEHNYRKDDCFVLRLRRRGLQRTRTLGAGFLRSLKNSACTPTISQGPRGKQHAQTEIIEGGGGGVNKGTNKKIW